MKSNSVRAAGIVLAVILGVAALLYLGGLISQLTIGYQKWLADGGMTGKATMGAIYFSPLACWRSAMKGSGLKCTLFTAVLAGGLFAFVRLQNRFGSNDYDPRNFTRSKRGTYGTSGWMSEKEMRSVLEVAGPERAKGIILGKTERGSVICLPEDTRLNKHIAVFGASGTMKSRGVIRPALFQSIRRGESVVVADPKSEMFADTAELFKKHGYTQIMLGATDDVTAEYFSARSGDMTVEVNSTMTTRQSLALAQVIPQYRYTEGIGRRRVLTPDEVLRLPNDELLIILRGQKVLRAKKFDFTEHPYAKECERTSIQRYQTDPAPAQPPEPPAQSMPAEPDMDKPPGPAPAAAAKPPVKAKPPQAKPKAPVPKTPSSGGQPSELPAKPAKRPKTLYESSRPPADF